jgi:hypothetical protein
LPGSAGVAIRRRYSDRLLQCENVIDPMLVTTHHVEETLLHGARIPEHVLDSIGKELLDQGLSPRAKP